jgi:hypothetical protein
VREPKFDIAPQEPGAARLATAPAAADSVSKCYGYSQFVLHVKSESHITLARHFRSEIRANLMNRTVLALFVIAFAAIRSAAAAPPPYNWVTKAGGPDSVFAAQIVADSAGNTYATGEFEGTATFGAVTLTSSGGRDIYVAKFGPDGTILWAKAAGSPGYDFGAGIAVDGAGAAYVTGKFTGTATFDTVHVTATGGDDLFVAKYDGFGNVVWVRRAGGSSTADDFTYGYGVGVDAGGNSYVTGAFYGDAQFGSVALSAADYDVFVAKFGPAGAPVWAKRAGGAGYDAAYGIAVDAAGNAAITGEYYSSSMSFGTATLTNSRFDDIFTARYNASGAVIWAQTGGGKGYDYGYGVAVDTSGNSYMVGGFDGAATFGTVNLSSASSSICAVKYGPTGSVVWAKNVVDPGNDANASVAVDSAANVYVASGVDSPTQRLFATKLDRSGAVLWTKYAGSQYGAIYGRGIAVDGTGRSYPISEFGGTVNFDAGMYTSVSPQDIAVAQIADANGLIQFATTSDITFENDGNILLNVTRTGGTSNAVSVAYATADGTAVASSDYTAKSGTLNFAAGQTTASIAVPITNDSTSESPETFSVTLSFPNGGALLGPNSKTTITIYNGNRPAVQFSAAAMAVHENAGPAKVTVQRTGNTDVTVSVQYATANGSALAGSDYTATSGQVTFFPGATSATFNVPILNDTATEASENFTVKLTSPSSNAILGAQKTELVQIRDDEKPVVQFSVSTMSVSENVGAATLAVVRTGDIDAVVSVNYETVNGSAFAGSDYTQTSGALTIAAGQSTATIDVPINNDATAEGTESFTAKLTSPSSNCALGAKPTDVVTIRDDEAPVLQFSPGSYSVSEGGGTVSLTVYRTGVTDVAVSANYTTGNATATAGSDYTASSGTVNLAAGQNTAKITVPIINDSTAEALEKFNVSLSAPSGATLGSQKTATVAIADDD